LLSISSDLTRPAFVLPLGGTNLNGLFSPLSGERDLFGLAPGGVYQATPIARGTGELLPPLFTLTLWNRRSRHSTGRYLFCGTFLTLWNKGFANLAGRICQPAYLKRWISYFPPIPQGSPNYGPPCPAELGLSSPLSSCKAGCYEERPSVRLRFSPPSFSLAILLWIA